MEHLFLHKKRLTVLKPKIERLPDGHRSKPECLFELSQLFSSFGHWVEEERLFIHALKIQRERGNGRQVAAILRNLSDSSWLQGLTEEGIQQAEEGSSIFEQLGDTVGQAQCLDRLTRLLCRDKQFDAAEEVASRAINLFSVSDNPFQLCESHRVLGEVYRDKGETEKAIHHFEIAFGIASPFNWHDQLFGVLYSLAKLFRNEGRFDNAQAHIERAKSMPSITNTTLAVRWRCRLGFGTSRIGSKRRGLRLCAPPTFTRGLGLRRTWRVVESSSR